MIDYSAIEKKWQKAWQDAHVFEPEPSDKQPLLVTVAIPYVNAPAHIGHFRTYSTGDTYARYMRMKGFNVRTRSASMPPVRRCSLSQKELRTRTRT